MNKFVERQVMVCVGSQGDIADAMDQAGFRGQVTGLGSLFRIHVHDRPLIDYRSSLMTPEEEARLQAIVEFMRDNGVFVNDRGVCSLSTPMGDAEIDAFLACFSAALAAVQDYGVAIHDADDCAGLRS